MSALRCVVYVSSAVRLLNELELEQLMESARKFNAESGITGVLLYYDGTFFQYFEGPETAVEQVYERIRRSPLHWNLIELFRSGIVRRLFEDWYMGLARPQASELLKIRNAEWQRQIQPLLPLHAESLPEGLRLLAGFWASAVRV